MRIAKDQTFYSNLKSLMVPIALQNLLMAAVSAGDSAMLGFVNSDAMAAVSLAANVEFIESLFLSSLVTGATILSAQYWGKGDRTTVQRVFTLMLRYALVIAGIFCGAALLAPDLLMAVFTDEAQLIALGRDYIRIASVSYLLTGITQCYLCIMKTTGQAKESVAISSFALGLDTVLNAVFIFIFHMDAKGVALTTTITRIVELCVVLFYSRKMAVRPKMIVSVSTGLHKDFLKVSIPHLINFIVWGVGTALYSVIFGHIGTAITTASSVAAIVRKLSIAICHGLGQGGDILLAGVLGSGDLVKGKEYGKRLSRLSILCGLVCAALAVIFGYALYHFMALSDEVRALLQVMIWISAFYMMAQCINIVVTCGVFFAGGDASFDAYSVAVTMWGIIIPLGLAAAFWWNLPPLVVYLILSLDEAVKIPWVYFHYRKYKWLRNMTREETA